MENNKTFSHKEIGEKIEMAFDEADHSGSYSDQYLSCDKQGRTSFVIRIKPGFISNHGELQGILDKQFPEKKFATSATGSLITIRKRPL